MFSHKHTYFPGPPELVTNDLDWEFISEALTTALNRVSSSTSPSPFSRAICFLYWAVSSISAANFFAASSRCLYSSVSFFSNFVLKIDANLKSEVTGKWSIQVCFLFLQENTLWVLFRSASMSTYNLCFLGDISKLWILYLNKSCHRTV